MPGLVLTCTIVEFSLFVSILRPLVAECLQLLDREQTFQDGCHGALGVLAVCDT